MYESYNRDMILDVIKRIIYRDIKVCSSIHERKKMDTNNMNLNENKIIKKEVKKNKEFEVPKKFNPRVSKVDISDERFFAFEAQRSHH